MPMFLVTTKYTTVSIRPFYHCFSRTQSTRQSALGLSTNVSPEHRVHDSQQYAFLPLFLPNKKYTTVSIMPFYQCFSRTQSTWQSALGLSTTVSSKHRVHRVNIFVTAAPRFSLKHKTHGNFSYLVSWHFEPSQPQRVTSWLKTMFNLSIYSARKSSNHKLFINHKISHDTNLHKTKHTQTSDTKFSKN